MGNTILTSNDVDFANVVDLIGGHSTYNPPLQSTFNPRYGMVTGQCPQAHGKFDSTSILWNKDRWQWVHSEQSGCMAMLGNVYTIQRFKHIASCQTLLVVGAHYPRGYAVDAELVKALQGLLDPNVPVLFMADANMEATGD